jgi:hypothetical protein
VYYEHLDLSCVFHEILCSTLQNVLFNFFSYFVWHVCCSLQKKKKTLFFTIHSIVTPVSYFYFFYSVDVFLPPPHFVLHFFIFLYLKWHFFKNQYLFFTIKTKKKIDEMENQNKQKKWREGRHIKEKNLLREGFILSSLVREMAVLIVII